MSVRKEFGGLVGESVGGWVGRFDGWVGGLIGWMGGWGGE